MKKLIQGIMEFRRTRRESMRETFAKLALGQNPDCLFIACSDSRVAANVFASTDPGDLFVVRNLGNIMPPFPDRGSAVAALEFSLEILKVSHIIVCGHSDCGAMRALAQKPAPSSNTPLAAWLKHASGRPKKASQIRTLSPNEMWPFNWKTCEPSVGEGKGSFRRFQTSRYLVQYPIGGGLLPGIPA